jgi:hypothetical protein
MTGEKRTKGGCGRAGRQETLSGRVRIASAFYQDHIPPASVHEADAFADSHHTKSEPFVKPDAGGVFGEDAGLQCPDSMPPGLNNERRKERGTDALPARRFGNVDADLGDTRVNLPALLSKRPQNGAWIAAGAMAIAP